MDNFLYKVINLKFMTVIYIYINLIIKNEFFIIVIIIVPINFILNKLF